VGTLEHLYQGVAIGGADAVLAASIFHFGEFTVGQARDYLPAPGACQCAKADRQPRLCWIARATCLHRRRED